MSNGNVLSVEDDAKDVEKKGRTFRIITKLMVLKANGEAQKI